MSAEIATLEPAAHEPLLADVKPDLGVLTAEQRQTWRETGEWPDAPTLSSSKPADSTPAKPAVQAASTDASSSTASEPVAPKKANADTRKAELAAEIQDLLSQRDRLRAEVQSRPARPSPDPDAHAASSPAPTKPSLTQLVNAPDPSQPLLSDAEFYEQFPNATIGDFAKYVTNHTVENRDQAKTAQQSRQSFFSAIQDVVKSVSNGDTAEYAKLMDTLQSPVSLLKAGLDPLPVNYAMEEVFQSPNAKALTAHLIEHPEILDGLTSQRDAIWTIARLDAQLDTPSVNSQPVPVTNAPAQPAKLSGKSAAPVDELEQAIRNRDTRAYNRIMNSREAKR